MHQPQGVGTDFETGHVIVADKGNNRDEIFEADKTFVKTFGQVQWAGPDWAAVDTNPASASHHDIWVTTEGGKGTSSLVKKFTAPGKSSKWNRFGDVASRDGGLRISSQRPIAVGSGGDIYVVDT